MKRNLCFTKIASLVTVLVLFFTALAAPVPSLAAAGPGTASGTSRGAFQAPTMTESELFQLVARAPRRIADITFVVGSDEVKVDVREDSTDPTTKLVAARYVVNITPIGVQLLHEKALAAGIPFDAEGGGGAGFSFFAIMPMLLMMIFIGLFAFMLFRGRRGAGAGGGAGSPGSGFTNSGAKKFETSQQTVKFADVAGQDEAKDELAEVVDFLKNPARYRALGAKIPRGVLLSGSPGNGKTLLAKAVAGESGSTFFSISGSNFVEMFVGVGASRVRNLFNQAKAAAPAIIFIDEIDAVGRSRGSGMGGGGNDEREQTLNQILVEMDGFEGSENVIVMAATNRPDILDAALMRPGRFDRQVQVDQPDKAGRVAILGVHTRGKPLAEGVNLETIAGLTPGFSGADLANVANEAALLAARRGLKQITMEELDEGISRTMLGIARHSRSAVMTVDVKRKVAYHEAGHAVVSHRMGQRIGKVTIMPRSRALGYAQTMPDDNQFVKTRDQLFADIAMALGGREADKMFSLIEHTGASNDFKQAFGMARRMVTEFGMSELGPISLGGGQDPFLRGPMSGSAEGVGPVLSDKIDAATRQILCEAEDVARQILADERETVERLVALLLDKETVLADEFALLMGEKPVKTSYESRDCSTRKQRCQPEAAEVVAMRPLPDSISTRLQALLRGLPMRRRKQLRRAGAR